MLTCARLLHELGNEPVRVLLNKPNDINCSMFRPVLNGLEVVAVLWGKSLCNTRMHPNNDIMYTKLPHCQTLGFAMHAYLCHAAP